MAEKDLAYYLTMIKLEGHSTWRVYLNKSAQAFDKEWAAQTQGKKPKITERRIIRIDRLTGGFGVK